MPIFSSLESPSVTSAGDGDGDGDEDEDEDTLASPVPDVDPATVGLELVAVIEEAAEVVVIVVFEGDWKPPSQPSILNDRIRA